MIGNYSKIGQIYKRILKDINTNGIETSPRGKKTKECINYSFTIKDITRVLINIIGIKEFSYKYLYSELLWYLEGDLSVDFIGQFASLWNRIKDIEGKVNSNYGYLTLINASANGRTQYGRALKSLIMDKNSRQAIIRYNSNEHQYDDVTDFTCTLNQQFFIRNNELIGIVNMRSNDVFYGLPYDIIRFSLIMQSLYVDLSKYYPDLKLGNMYYNAGSMHYYEEFYEKVDKIINNSLIKTKQIKLNSSLIYIKNNINIDKLKKQALRNKHKTNKYFKKLFFRLITKSYH